MHWMHLNCQRSNKQQCLHHEHKPFPHTLTNLPEGHLLNLNSLPRFFVPLTNLANEVLQHPEVEH